MDTLTNTIIERFIEGSSYESMPESVLGKVAEALREQGFVLHMDRYGVGILHRPDKV